MNGPERCRCRNDDSRADQPRADALAALRDGWKREADSARRLAREDADVPAKAAIWTERADVIEAMLSDLAALAASTTEDGA